MTDLPESMRAVQLTAHGNFDRLQYRDDLPLPVVQTGDVLIKVGAAGVNNTDINTRVGWYSKNEGAADDASWAGEALKFPRIQGIDVCGTIIETGEGIDIERIGQRVLVEPCLLEAHGQTLPSPWFLGSECDGGFAEYVVVASRHAHAINSTLSDAELASFPCSYSTAENLLTRSRVQAGETVLITGASGGVGSAALQLVLARKARPIVVTSDSKRQTLLDLGAAKAIDRQHSLLQQLQENSVDVVIDLVGGKQWPELLQLLKPGGRYAVSGAIGGPMVELDLRTLYLKDISLFGCTVLEAEVFPNLIRYIEQQHIKPLLAKTYPLQDIVEAQKFFLQKQHIGKIVLTMSTTTGL